MHAFFHSCCGRAVHLHQHMPAPLAHLRQQGLVASNAAEKQGYSRTASILQTMFCNQLCNTASERCHHLGFVLLSIKLRVITVVEKVSGHLVHF